MIFEQSTDEQIVKRVLKGDVDVFKLIVNRYKDYIFSIGMRFFKNEYDSGDFAQEIFLKAFNELSSFKGKAPFRFWLVKIAYNYGINRVKAKKIDDVFFEDAQSAEPGPEKAHIKNETIRVLREAIAGLPEKYRTCMDMYFYLGLSYNKINEITGFPVNTIKSNVLRAKNILRDKLRGSIAEDYHEM